MGRATCCVVNCGNTGRNSNCSFYSFPIAKHKLDQRDQWINSVRRMNGNGSQWYPKPSDKICCKHFIGNKKGTEPTSPNYIPTVFPSIYKAKIINETVDVKRHERFMARRRRKEATTMDIKISEKLSTLEDICITSQCETTQAMFVTTCIDKGCLVETSLLTSPTALNTMICNRYIYNNEYSEIETQTDIVKSRIIVNPKTVKYSNKECNTEQKTFVDEEINCDIESDVHMVKKMFCGRDSIKTNQQMLDLAGVTIDNFQFLLTLISSGVAETHGTIKENRLLVFLMKMKTGLTFSAMAVILSLHRTTISRIFFSVLADLACNTKNLVFWPEKDVVRATIPQCFHPKYSNTRVIIDCTEFKIEIPSKLDNRVYTYSNYKKGFTAKLLLGITPSGFICFKSKVAGGRKSDSQITIESGLLDKLDDGDIVLADKGFPQIQTSIDNARKKVTIVMPPFVEKKTEFKKEETEKTYDIAKVRIHVERVMQRLRIYRILDKIPENLFHCIDDIVQVCCALVNLQPPIIVDTE